MKAILCVLALLVAVPVSAQDDCPAGHVRNQAVSPLDHDYMVKAFTASFRGLFGRDPSMQPGSGKDDGEYYIAAANHFGVYGDDQCHAGWSGYWESWLQNGHGDLGAVQTPARFLPMVAPPIVPPPPPVVTPPVVVPPAPLPSIDLSGVYAQIAVLSAKLDALAANVTAGRTENQTFFEAVKTQWKAIVGKAAIYAGPIIAAIFAGRATK